MQLPTENLTFASLLTLGGLTLAVYLITTAIRQVWQEAPTKVVGLAVSLALTVVVLAVNDDYSGQAVTTAIVNAFLAFLVYLTAAGFSLSVDAMYRKLTKRVVAERYTYSGVSWWRSW